MTACSVYVLAARDFGEDTVRLSKTTVIEISGTESVAIITSLYLVFNNVSYHLMRDYLMAAE